MSHFQDGVLPPGSVLCGKSMTEIAGSVLATVTLNRDGHFSPWCWRLQSYKWKNCKTSPQKEKYLRWWCIRTPKKAARQMSRDLSRMEQASGCACTARPFFLEILGGLQTSKERDYRGRILDPEKPLQLIKNSSCESILTFNDFSLYLQIFTCTRS